MPVSKRTAAALRWGKEERDDLAHEFLDVKVFTWVETIAELLHEHGVDIDEDSIDVSDDILRALRAEAREHAAFVVGTYNDDLARFLERNADIPREQLLGDYEAWAVDRAGARAETIAISEAYTASADATTAFYLANTDAEPLYNFDHSHPGDDAPSCAVCVALEAGNPHTHETVVRVGSPHLGCRQRWGLDEGSPLRDELAVPTAVAGIIGSQPLVNRHGNDHEAAAAAILSGDLSAPGTASTLPGIP